MSNISLYSLFSCVFRNVFKGIYITSLHLQFFDHIFILFYCFCNGIFFHIFLDYLCISMKTLNFSPTHCRSCQLLSLVLRVSESEIMLDQLILDPSLVIPNNVCLLLIKSPLVVSRFWRGILAVLTLKSGEWLLGSSSDPVFCHGSDRYYELSSMFLTLHP